MVFHKVREVAVAALFALSPVIITLPIMQEPASAQSRQSVAPELQGVLPQLQQRVNVPILLPSALPSQELPTYISWETDWSLYSIDLAFTPGCSGSACFLGSFSAYDTREALEGERIELANGVTGYLRHSCPICGDLSLAWEQNDVVYLIRYKASSENLITMANSAIQAGNRAEIASSQTANQSVRTERNLSQTDLAAIQQAVVAAVGRPGLPEPTVYNFAVEGPWGLAAWQMGEAGGLVALWKEEIWEVYPLGGGMPTAQDVNQRSDIPVDVAQRLLDRLFAN